MQAAACHAAASPGEACHSRGAALAGRGHNPWVVGACPARAGPRVQEDPPAAQPRAVVWAVPHTAAAVVPTAGGPTLALALVGLLGTSARQDYAS